MQNRSNLGDFNAIDNASRGLRGAVQVLLRPHLGLMALLGALATLLAIAIGPMLQETVILKPAWLPNPDRNASAPVSRFFAPASNPELPKLDIGLRGTILNGLSQANSSALEPIFGCSSGNCTYERPYTSLGLCHQCQRLEVKRQCNDVATCNYTLANGHVLINQAAPAGFGGDFSFINVSTAFNTTGEMQSAQFELPDQGDVVRASIISLTNGPLCKTSGTNPDCVLPDRNASTQQQLFDGGAIGAYCDLALCTNTYTARITESRLNERIVASSDARNVTVPHYFFQGTPSGETGATRADPVILPEKCFIGGRPYALDKYKDSNNASWTYVELQQTLGNGNQNNFSNTTAKVPLDCVFAMRAVTYQSLIQFMSNNAVFLDGNGASDSNTGVAGGIFSFLPNGGAQENAIFANQAAFGVEPIFNNGNASFESIDTAFGRLANAMTTYMRDNSGHPQNPDYTGIEAQLVAQRANAKGVLYGAKTIVVVQWYWIILPLVVLLMVVVYLVGAIVQGGVKDLDGNTQAHLWKSSAIVPLVIGHRSQLPGSTAALEGPDMMGMLKKREMKLVGSKGGWIFVETDAAGRI